MIFWVQPVGGFHAPLPCKNSRLSMVDNPGKIKFLEPPPTNLLLALANYDGTGRDTRFESRTD